MVCKFLDTKEARQQAITELDVKEAMPRSSQGSTTAATSAVRALFFLQLAGRLLLACYVKTKLQVDNKMVKAVYLQMSFTVGRAPRAPITSWATQQARSA